MRILAITVAMAGLLAPSIANDQYTIVYLDPDRAPNSDYLVEQLPSYYFMAGAPVRVSYRPNAGTGVRSIRAGTGQVSIGTGDVNCNQIAAPVYVGSYDPNRLDGDEDGWGCDQ